MSDHSKALWRESSGSGVVPGITLLGLVTDAVEGHTFAAGAPVGSLVANGVEGFDATLGDFSADVTAVVVGGSTFVA